MRIESFAYIGSSEFAAIILEGIMARRYVPKLVITQADKAQGRKLLLAPTPVGNLAEQRSLPVIKPDDINSDEVYELLQTLDLQILITASYGGMIGRRLRKMCPYAAVNLHPSLLPRYRGASPIQSALLNGDKISGTSLFRLSARLDAGAVLVKRETPILPGENYSALHDRLAHISTELLVQYLTAPDSECYHPQKQDDSNASYAAKIEKPDTWIDWNLPATQIKNKIRALSYSPGAQSSYKNQTIKIMEAEALDLPASGIAGSFASLYKDIGFTVNTGAGQLLIKQMQSSGKKLLSAWSWQLGARLCPSDRFGS